MQTNLPSTTYPPELFDTDVRLFQLARLVEELAASAREEAEGA